MMKLNRRMLGFLFEKCSARYVRLVEKNLRIAFPLLSAEEITQLRRRVYSHFSSMFVEIAYLFVKQNPEKILKPIEVRNLQALENALKKGKGVILFSAHFGNWELVPYILSRALKQQINSIAREMNNPLVEKRVKQFREFMGSSVIYKKNSIRSVLDKFKNNGIVFLLVDHNTIEREAVVAEFFGVKVNAVPTVSHLHIRKGTPAVPVFLHYEQDKIVLEVMEELQFDRTGEYDADVVRLTQTGTSLIEEKIKQYPEQWFWFHNRWKSYHPEVNTNKENTTEINDTTNMNNWEDKVK